MGLRRPSITEQSITTGAFAVIVLGMAIASMCRWTISSKNICEEEKRRYSSCPHLRFDWQSIAAFPAGFDAFYNDRFAERQTLVSTINFLKYKGFSYSSNPKVLVSKHDWLYFLDGGDEETLRNSPPFSHEELENWVRYFEARQAWLAQRNIHYLLFFAPSKCTIYPEHVPAAMGRSKEKSRLDQLFEALRHNSHVEFVDVRQAMSRAKPFAPLYFKTDTHWNQLGAYVAYAEVMKRLKRWYPGVEPLKLSELKIDDLDYAGGDLVGMLGLRGLVKEKTLQAHLRKVHWVKSPHPDSSHLMEEAYHTKPFATEVDDNRLPKAVCFRDSYMMMPQPYFSENFRRVAYYWRFDFPTEVIDEEKPSIVIQEFLERGLARGIPSNPPEVERCAQVQLFAARPDQTELAQRKVLPTN